MKFSTASLLRARNLLLALALGVAALSPSAASATVLDDIMARKVVRIAVDMGAPPYGMVDKDAQPVGSDIETAKLLAGDLGVALDIIPVTGPTRVPFLLTGKADLVIASFSITDERKKVIDFSTPYAAVPIVIAGPSNVVLKSFADLTGKTIAVTRGTTSDQQLTKGVQGALRRDDRAVRGRRDDQYGDRDGAAGLHCRRGIRHPASQGRKCQS